MLTTILIAPMLSLTQFVVTPHEPVPPVAPTVRETTFVPHGSMTGSWASASVMADGHVTGVLVDAQNLPLWILDARMGPGGDLTGDLIPLEYATNPALGMLDLAIYGQAQIGRDGSGTFWAVIHSPYQGISLPVYPLGQMQGTLYDGWPPANKPGGVNLTRGGLHGAPHRARAGPRCPARIVCPKGPNVALSSVTPASARTAASGLPTRAVGGAAAALPGSVSLGSVHNTWPRSAQAHAIPPGFGGMVYATWVLDNL